MTLPAGGGRGAPPELARGAGDPLALPGSGVGAVDEAVEDGRDHPGPVVVLGCGVAVSLAVTRRGCEVEV